MNRSEENAKTWNKLVDWYEQNFMEFELYNESYDVFCQLINQAQASIFEIGCGPGNICHYISKKQNEWHWLGIDTAAEMLVRARKNNPTKEFKQMDALSISSLQQKFDGMIVGFCLPYLSSDEVQKLIKDAYHLLKTKGLLYLSFVQGEVKDSKIQKNGDGDEMHFFYHNRPTIENQLEENYFKICWCQVLDYTASSGRKENHHILIAEKI